MSASPVFYFFLMWVIIVYLIYYRDEGTMSWERRRKKAAVTTLILTILITPFSLWGVYNLNGLSNGGLEGDYSDSFSLDHQDTYKSLTLSNMFSDVRADLIVSNFGGPCVFYLCDENNPEVWYSETNITSVGYNVMYIQLELPYLYTDFILVANWTLNFYNPSQTEHVSITFDIYDHSDVTILVNPPQPGPLYKYVLPIAVLFGLWGVAGVGTLLARAEHKRKTTPSVPQEKSEVREVEPHEEELEMVRSTIYDAILDWGSVDGFTIPLKRLKKSLDIPENLKDMIIKKFIERSKGKFQAAFYEVVSDIVDMKFDTEKDALVFDFPSPESEE